MGQNNLTEINGENSRPVKGALNSAERINVKQSYRKDNEPEKPKIT